MKISIILITTFIYPFSLFAQATVKTEITTQSISQSSYRSTIEPLSVGDSVPDIQFTMLNYASENVRLSFFSGKLVILDFWATWCGSCISQFPKMDSLQKIFNGKLQIILVNSKDTRDTRDKIEKFFKLRKENKSIHLLKFPTTVQDTISSLLFPHSELPHYVWISPAGKVIAITASEQVTKSNIQDALESAKVSLPQKVDFDDQKLVYLYDAIRANDVFNFSIFMKGKKVGLPVINRQRSGTELVCGRAMYNVPILTMYEEALIDVFKESTFMYKQMSLEVQDISKLIFRGSKSERSNWEKNNLYSYELILPISDAKKLNDRIVSDLNKYSDYVGRIEKRKVKCLMLVRISNVDKIASTGKETEIDMLRSQHKYHLRNSQISFLVDELNRIEDFRIPVIDKTNYLSNVDIDIFTKNNDISELRKALNRYDLDLIEAESELDIFVLHDK